MTDAAPSRRPCGSCPYRRDVPSGVWDASEYAKLPSYDAPTYAQPVEVFLCHQQDGRTCAGWAGCHDMDESLALRIVSIDGSLTPEEVEAIRAYEPPIDLFDSGAEGTRAQRVIGRLERKFGYQTPPQVPVEPPYPSAAPGSQRCGAEPGC